MKRRNPGQSTRILCCALENPSDFWRVAGRAENAKARRDEESREEEKTIDFVFLRGFLRPFAPSRSLLFPKSAPLRSAAKQIQFIAPTPATSYTAASPYREQASSSRCWFPQALPTAASFRSR